ncbi:MAG: hypothetical protein KDJ45_07545 [Hyphomicrobiaceae bacterium]|nr:hypothetical protein [Hyphomicrobiaceae bacterium]
MMTIQSVMLVALGVLSAAFIVLLVIPFYRRRTERLAVADVKRHLPMTEAEIRADKDRLRAEYAIRIHQLETRVDEATHQAARQKIELNRRDGAINDLEGKIGSLTSALEEHENARRVLEQSITDRLPKVEERLNNARELLHERDQEIERLSRSADRTARALEETRQINTQQRDELLRTSAALSSRAARNRDQLADPRFDGEVALRSEIEALRARAREQAGMITRLQGLLVRGGKSSDFETQDGDPDSDMAAAGGDQSADARELAKVRSRLAEAESSLKVAQSSAEAGHENQKKRDGEVRELQSRNDSLTAEVARLKAALSIYESAQKDDSAIKDSKVAMKARLGALEAEIATRNETVGSLRAELAAANERLARQAEHYRDELRQLGAGSVPTAASQSRKEARDEEGNGGRQSLAERMGAPRPVALKPVAGAGVDQSRTANYLRALSGKPVSEQLVSLSDIAASGAEDRDSTAVTSQDVQLKGAGADHPKAAAANPPKPETDGPPQRRRSSLLDRISSVSKSSS